MKLLQSKRCVRELESLCESNKAVLCTTYACASSLKALDLCVELSEFVLLRTVSLPLRELRRSVVQHKLRDDGRSWQQHVEDEAEATKEGDELLCELPCRRRGAER